MLFSLNIYPCVTVITSSVVRDTLWLVYFVWCTSADIPLVVSLSHPHRSHWLDGTILNITFSTFTSTLSLPITPFSWLKAGNQWDNVVSVWSCRPYQQAVLHAHTLIAIFVTRSIVAQSPTINGATESDVGRVGQTSIPHKPWKYSHSRRLSFARMKRS